MALGIKEKAASSGPGNLMSEKKSDSQGEEEQDMSVIVKLSPWLRKYVPGYNHDTGLLFEQGKGKKVSQLIEELTIPIEKVTSVLVNYKPSNIEYAAEDGDMIFLALVVGGG